MLQCSDPFMSQKTLSLSFCIAQFNTIIDRKLHSLTFPNIRQDGLRKQFHIVLQTSSKVISVAIILTQKKCRDLEEIQLCSCMSTLFHISSRSDHLRQTIGIAYLKIPSIIFFEISCSIPCLRNTRFCIPKVCECQRFNHFYHNKSNT